MGEEKVMTIVGIDAGFATPGLAAVAYPGVGTGTVIECLAIVTEREDDLRYRAMDDARRIHDTSVVVCNFIEKHKPDVVVVELPSSGGKSATAVKGMAFAAAQIVAILAALKLKAVYINPRMNKIASTGNPLAEKEDVIAGVSRVWDHIPWEGPPKAKRKQEASADALSAIVWWLINHKRDLSNTVLITNEHIIQDT